MENAARLAGKNFCPLPADIAHVKLRTTGVYHISITLDSIPVMIVDVGGQRCERRKWMHCFDDVTAVLFFCPIGDYNMALEEDRTSNRLEESLKLFQNLVVDSGHFVKALIVLFLNKSDLFQQRINQSNIRKYLPGIPSSCTKDWTKAARYIRALFEKKLPPNMKMRSHVTCAVNPNDCRTVITDIKRKILTSHLSRIGC